MTHTLRLRLILSMLALLVPTMVIAGWLLLEVFGNRLLRDLDVALEEEATTVAALLEDPASADSVAALVTRIADETDLARASRSPSSRASGSSPRRPRRRPPRSGAPKTSGRARRDGAARAA